MHETSTVCQYYSNNTLLLPNFPIASKKTACISAFSNLHKYELQLLQKSYLSVNYKGSKALTELPLSLIHT